MAAHFVSFSQSGRQSEPIHMQTDDGLTSELPTPPRNRETNFKRTWEYDVPELSTFVVEDKQMPEMPNLESILGNSLRSVSPMQEVFL